MAETLTGDRPKQTSRFTLTVLMCLWPAAGMLFEHLVPLLDEGAGYCFVFPTWVHVLAWILAMAIGASVIEVVENGKDLDHVPQDTVPATAMLGFVLGLAAYYCVLLGPYTPIFLFGVICFGLGPLGLAPYMVLIGGIVLARRLRPMWGALKRPAAEFRKRLLAGAAIGLLFMVAMEVPGILTELALRRAFTDRGATARAAFVTLRVGNPEELLRRCYVRGGRAHWMWSSLLDAVFQEGSPGPEACRRIFFRVMGKPFNHYPAPLLLKSTFLRDDFGRGLNDWIADQEVGATAVRGRVTELSLTSSQIGGTFDTAAAIASLSWEMELRNDSSRQREARMRIQLPPGAASSGLSLWIDGKECQAAFGGRQQTRQAYQSVAVVQRRDPALLSTLGPGQALLQVFPVQPRSSARVKVQFTCPLAVDEREQRLRLPCVTERNFDVKNELRHLVWLSPAAENNASAIGRSPATTVKRELDDRELLWPPSATLGFPARLPRDPAPDLPGAFSADSDGFTVQRLLRVPAGGAPSRVFLVVDGSTTVGELNLGWRYLLERWPAGQPVTAIVAGDVLARLEAAAGSAELHEWLGRQTFAGGTDPVPALQQALEEAEAVPGSLVIWLHGQQAMALSEAAGLRRQLARQGAGPILMTVAAAEGPNATLQALDGLPRCIQAPRLGLLKEDLLRALRAASAARQALVPRQDSASDAVFGSDVFGPVIRLLSRSSTMQRPAGLRQTSDQLSRLWAFEASRALAARGDEKRAIDLALRFRLVTPVTGAVVLERKQDYEEHGLDPSKPAAVPVHGVPEPELWALLFVAMATLGYASAGRPTRASQTTAAATIAKQQMPRAR